MKYKTRKYLSEKMGIYIKNYRTRINILKDVEAFSFGSVTSKVLFIYYYDTKFRKSIAQLFKIKTNNFYIIDDYFILIRKKNSKNKFHVFKIQNKELMLKLNKKIMEILI